MVGHAPHDRIDPVRSGLGVVDVALVAAIAWGWWPRGRLTLRLRSVAVGSAARVAGWLGSVGVGSVGERSRWRSVGAAVGVVLAIGFGLLIPPTFTVAAVVGAWALARAHRRRAQARARSAEVAALPLSLELCQVTLGAGGTVFDCLRVLADEGPEPVRQAAVEGIEAARSGSRLDVALGHFQDRLGLAFQPLTGALLLGLRQGGSIGLLLHRLTVEANASRRRLGELRARRLPVQLLGPLVVFALPAVVIGAIVPLIVVAVRSLDL
jgi:Flp pilus assembly protein TadB